jgi:DNA-binding beta-propeller fold protein YncE
MAWWSLWSRRGAAIDLHDAAHLANPANNPLSVDGVAVDERVGHIIADLNLGRGGNGYVSTVDAASATVLRMVPTGGFTASATGIDEAVAHAFVLDCAAGYDDGVGVCTVRVVDTRSGALLGSPVGVEGGDDPYTEAVVIDGRAQRAFAVVQPHAPQTYGKPDTVGYITVFDTLSGRLLHGDTVSGGLAGVAWDEQMQRLFVANNLAGTVSVYDAARL